MGVETGMKDGEWGTKEERGEDGLSIWKITAVSRLLLLQSRGMSHPLVAQATAIFLPQLINFICTNVP